MSMNIEIKKLSADVLDDWLQFFDNTAFSDNDEWAGCYCMCYHWSEALASKKGWDCSKSGAAYNREHAVRFIEQGIMQGYLAYYDGKAVGWCNANDKQVYDSVNIDLTWEDSEKGKKVKSIVCFCISPDLRGKGIASRLLEKVCSDAAVDGYEYVEAYPFVKDEYNYHGSKSMYEKNGFTVCGEESGCTIVRKHL
jgi:GNAT superfamily N-acetyltransferase